MGENKLDIPMRYRTNKSYLEAESKQNLTAMQTFDRQLFPR